MGTDAGVDLYRKTNGLTIVILDIGVAGRMSVFTVVVSRNVDPLVPKLMLVIAEGMMEETMLLPFAAEGTLSAKGSGLGVTRSAFNDGPDDDHTFRRLAGSVPWTAHPLLALLPMMLACRSIRTPALPCPAQEISQERRGTR